jgi:hypothetical protein
VLKGFGPLSMVPGVAQQNSTDVPKDGANDRQRLFLPGGRLLKRV